MSEINFPILGALLVRELEPAIALTGKATDGFYFNLQGFLEKRFESTLSRQPV